MTPSESAPGPTTATHPPVKVLFIAALGRSGSTILDNVLGQLDGFFSAGELRLSWNAPWLVGRSCGCGSPLTECSIWSQVLAEDSSPSAAARSNYFRYPDKPWHWLRFGLGMKAHPSRHDAERLQNRYRTLRDLSGAQVIVDSSKKPAYAQVLAAVPGIDLYVLHLVRDPRGVANSWAKQVVQPGTRGRAFMKRRHVAGTAMRWNALNHATAREHAWPPGRYLRLHYEQFIAHPQREIGSIVEWLGEPADPSRPFVTERTVRLSPTHTVWGNPSRFRTGEVELREDESWRTQLSHSSRRWVSWLTVPLRRRYGYPRFRGLKESSDSALKGGGPKTEVKPPNSDASVLAGGASLALVGRIVGQAIQVVTEIMLARTLGPAVFGLYAAGWAMLRVLGLVSPLGLDRGAVRFGTRYYRSDPSRMRALIFESVGWALLVGFGVGSALYFGADRLATAFEKPGLAPVLRGLAPAVMLFAALRVAAALTRVLKQVRYAVLSEELSRPISNLLMIGLSTAMGWGLGGAVAACSASFGLAFLLAISQVRFLFPSAFKPGVRRQSVSRELWRFSLPVSISGAAVMVLVWIDRIMLAFYGTSAEVGIYQAATQPAFVFSTILVGFNAILVPMIADLTDRNEPARLIELYRVSTKWSLYASTPVFLVFCFVPDALIGGLFGSAYLGGVTPLIILAVGQLVNAGTGAVGPLLIMTGHQKRWMTIAIIVLTLDILLAWQLIPRMGMVGAAVATSIAIATLFGAGVWQVHRVLGAWPYDSRHLKGPVAAATAAGALWLLGRIDFAHPIVELFVTLLVAVVVYGATLLLLGLDDDDRQFIQVIRARIKKAS